MSNVNERQVGGDHYKGAKFQHWDLIAKNRIGYLEGCATKYPSRWRKKNGVEDVEKGIHFVDKILACVEEFGYGPTGHASSDDLFRFFDENNIADGDEITAITLICQWTNVAHLEQARIHLERLLEKAKQVELMPLHG